ncbi:hypothetical protein [Singulisphaera acidiphila]|uniref:Uncharacterized protein n=1 Tax=Singulisphaera acidiphila (strain ATCC BAA-1392 / DSM 18658 / VKM B-2454 / MOB10) TaxID=886293 RepID=L0DGS5_SINAD|nr:hypothetical protein [Singulisphaera acidiphila]AGA28013.1 hypothetical protein Sinac_3780 [Singulisphaera acidiphila DSM 18658]
MRHDDHSSSPNLSSTTEPRLGSRVRAWAWPVVLVVLMVLTSLALAFTVSVWLVPPYFILMVWILAPAQGPRDHVPAPLAPGSQRVSDDESESLLEPSELEIGLRSQAETVVLASSPSETAADLDGGNDPDPVMVKTKRGRGRGRKAKGGPVVEPTVAPATWIQVGPGKFVRVEGPSTNADTQTEPVLAQSESDPTSPLPSALPASEDVEERVSQELAAEVSPESENRSAIFDAPAARDEFTEDEPITDNVPPSSDGEALLRPSSEEVLLSEEEPVPGELAVEISPEPENCLATFDAPAAYDEFPQDEPITDDVPSSSDAEALLRPSSEEVVLPEEELVHQELAAEVSPEFEDRPALFDEPAARDEFTEDEPIADADFSPSDAEALLRPSPEEAVLSEEEPVSGELTTEFSPEFEDRSVSFDAPAACDEFPQDEPITDADFASSDAEASLRPSSEEVLWSDPDGSLGDVSEVPVPRELAAEFSPELEDRSATFDEPAACDESIQDESITVADVAFSAPDLEACPQPSPEEVVLPEPDGDSPDFELHQDETDVDEGACQDTLASHEDDEVSAEVEVGSVDFAEVTGESVPASSRLEDHELGPVEPSGDQGIALDAPAVAWTTEFADPPFEEAESVRSPSPRAVIAPPRSTDNAPFVSWRGVWPRVGPATVGRPSGARPSRRVVRSGPNARVSPGFRWRSRRGVGSYRLVCRTFPPRSPPVRGTIPRFETGRGVRESD